jgi:hypothetical protein
MTGSDVIKRLAEAIAAAAEELPAAEARVRTERQVGLLERLEEVLRDGVLRLEALADEFGIEAGGSRQRRRHP